LGDTSLAGRTTAGFVFPDLADIDTSTQRYPDLSTHAPQLSQSNGSQGESPGSWKPVVYLLSSPLENGRIARSDAPELQYDKDLVKKKTLFLPPNFSGGGMKGDENLVPCRRPFRQVNPPL